MKILKKIHSGAFALGFLSLFCSVNTASAELLVFDVSGKVDAPILWTKKGKWYQTGNNFVHDVNIGDLVFTYDTDSGVSTLTGTTTGCIKDCSSAFDGTRDGRGEYVGSGEFEWDLEFGNPLDAYTEDDGSAFGYNMQDAGTISLLDGNAPKVSNVSIKNDKNFAFRAYETDPGVYLTEAWFALMGGVVGGHSRFETGPNNAALNWELTLYLRDTPPPPPTDVPEPISMSLLGAGLVGGLGMKRKKSKSTP